MADLFGLPVGQLGLLGAMVLIPWGIVAFTIRRIVTGDLVAQQQLADARADRDNWRTAHDTQQAIALRHGMTLERLLSLAETGNHVMAQIQAGLHYRPEDQR